MRYVKGDNMTDSKKTTKKRKKITKSEEKPKELDKNTEPTKTGDDKFDNSFYTGKGGCYTLNEQGMRVPVKEE